MNPLLGITQSLGLSPSSIAKMLGLDGKLVASALSSEPSPTLQAYIAIENGLMMKRTLRGVPPMKVCLDTSYVHGLYKNNEFRALHRFCPVHEKITEMQKLICRYKVGRTTRFVAARLEREFLPTWNGHRRWQSSTIQHFTNHWNPKWDNAKRSEPGDIYFRDWREYVVRDWWLMPCFPDPSWMVRYELEVTLEGEKILVSTKKPLPAFIDRHIFIEMDKNPWFRGKWKSE